MIMTSKRAPVNVHVWATKHRGKDVWVFAVDKPGPGPELKPSTRYTRRHSASVGGARSIGAYPSRWYDERTGKYVTKEWRTQDGRLLAFIYSKPVNAKKTKKK